MHCNWQRWNPICPPIVLLALLLGIALALPAVAGAAWVAVGRNTPAPPTVAAADDGADRVVLSIELPGYFSETVLVDGVPYAQLSVPSTPPSLKLGLPEVPVIAASVIVPGTGDVTLQVLDSRWREIPTLPVIPSKGDLPRTIDPAKVPFTFAPLYADGGIFPDQPVEVGTPYILRDHRGVAVRVYPLRYDAGRGILLALESLTCEIVTAGGGGANLKRRPAAELLDPQFARVYDAHFLNAGSTFAKYTPIARPGPMLIVCYDPLLSQVAPLAAWKRQRGLPVEVVGTSQIGGSVAAIQSAITTRYNSAEGLTYVILVGDIAQVPSYTGTVESFADCDARYGMIEGSDNYPDLFVSRISGATPEQVQLQVAKFVRYERDPDPSGSWYHKGTGIASNENGGTALYDYERANLLRDDLLAYTFTEIDRIYQGFGGSTAGITSALNEGRSLVNYIGHGSGTSWSSVTFTNTNVHALSNGWQQPWIIDVSCDNGDFSMGECFAEAWLRAGTVAQPKGAVGMYSASTSTSWVPPCVMQTEAVDLLVGDVENSLGALYFSGGMKALDTYPGNEGVKLIQQYNIFGDCSLVVRTDTPATLAPAHPPVVYLNAPSFTVSVPGLAGATACLTRDGEIVGSATTGADGEAVVPLVPPLTTVGDVTLTITAYNHAPYISTLMAVPPATVVVAPDSIPVGVATLVTVTVTDTLGVGIASVTVQVSGYGVEPLVEVTDDNGEAAFTVSPLYGEDLRVFGRETGASYDLFSAALTVTGAAPIGGATVTADVAAIGLEGALTPHLEGIVTAAADAGPLVLFLTGCGLDLSASDAGALLTVPVTPTTVGMVTAVLAQEGSQIHTVMIPVVPAYGRLSGVVTDQDNGGAPLAGVRVFGHPAGADTSAGTPLFDLLSGVDGAYSVTDSLPVADYDLYFSKFAYVSRHDPIFLMHGDNEHDVALTLAPHGTLSGVVTSTVDGSPVGATIRVYRADNQALYAEVSSDPLDGAYSVASLPHFGYRIDARANGFIPQSADIVVDGPMVTRDFALDPTSGDILIIDDDPSKDAPPKLGKNGSVIAEGYAAPAARSGAQMAADLTALGYNVTIESMTSTVPATWPLRDCLIVTSGNNITPLNNATFRTALQAYAVAGGHLLIEGGEVAYYYRSNAPFASQVLRIAGWNHDSSGNLTVASASHHVMSVPNVIAGPVTLNYVGYGDADAVTPAAGTVRAGGWTTYPNEGSVLAYDPNTAPQGGQYVFFTFNYLALSAATRPLLLENAVQWLVTPEFGNCRLAGRAHSAFAGDDSGIEVTLLPLNQTATTGPDGAFSFDDLFLGTYQLVATKSGYASAGDEVVLVDGQQVTDLFLALAPMVSLDHVVSPGLPIPDNNTAGITSEIVITSTTALTSIGVYVDIAHTYIADLVIDLTAPSGTNVRLHSFGGGDADNIVGWYPQELTPAQSLSVLLGQNPAGTWVLTVSDRGPMDYGTLNAWGLRLTEPMDLSDVDDSGRETPRVLSLAGNVPNPFNPRTEIGFALPRAGEVRLSVFDLRGRRVATLVNGALPAGHHIAIWNGVDSGGAHVSSGTYFYRLQADGETLVRKMNLIK